MKYKIIITILKKENPKQYNYVNQEIKIMSDFNFKRLLTIFHNIKGKNITNEELIHEYETFMEFSRKRIFELERKLETCGETLK